MRNMQFLSMEKALQTILIALITTGVGWLCVSTVDARAQMASVATEIVNLKEQVKDMRDERRQDMIDLAARITALELAVFKQQRVK